MADDTRAKTLASPPLLDRRDLIARLEAHHATLARKRADAVAEVAGALQAGSSELGAARAHMAQAASDISRLDKALDGLYEQEREGADRAIDKRARELESDLCERRVEAVLSYLVSKGAPTDRLKTRPPKLKAGTEDAGRVVVESWVAHKKSQLGQ